MATTVGQHSVASFTSPVNGTTPIDANTVRGNDNTIRVAYVDHDADPGIHVQSSTLASRPTAGTAGRKWITTDTGQQKLWYDDGTDWHEVGGDAITLYCKATESIAKGDIVKVTGYNVGQAVAEIAKVASASDVAFGIANQAIANGSLGYVINTGTIQDVNTNSFSIGNVLYPNTSGGLTATKPTSGTYQPVAYVLRANATNGVLYVEFSAPRIVESSSNTASTVVQRDASGNFSAGTITAGALTSTGLVTFASLKGTGATTVTDILNDSTMATASATTLATSSSIKTYVDTKVATVDTLAEVLANGNTTGATDIIVNAGQKIRTPLVAAQDGTSAITIANTTGALTLNTALADSNLATISTAGKVANSATTAASANTASAIVARDASGNFTAGTITAALTGNASTATKLATARNINGVAFDGTADITVTAAAGTLTGNTLASNVLASSLTSVGTLTSLTVSGVTSLTGGGVLQKGTGTIRIENTFVGRPAGASGIGLDIGNTSGTMFVESYDVTGTAVAPLRLASSAMYLRTAGVDRLSIDASGNLAVDTNTLYVDAVNNLVGIGATPSTSVFTGSSGVASKAQVVATDNTTTLNLTTAALVIQNESTTNNTGAALNFVSRNTGNTAVAHAAIYGLTGTRNAGWNNGSLIFATGDASAAPTERMRLDASGNLGLGVTPSAWGGGFAVAQYKGGFIGSQSGAYLYSGQNAYFDTTDGRWERVATGEATLYEQNVGRHVWYNAGSSTANTAISWTQAMTLDASGNLEVGTSTSKAQITNAGYYSASNTTNTAKFEVGLLGGASSAIAYVYQRANDALVFGTNNAERARITSGGYFKASNTGTYLSSTGSQHEFVTDSAAGDGRTLSLRNSNASVTADAMLYLDVDRNTTNNTFYAIGYYNNGAGAWKFRVADSGDVTNTNNSYGAISDEKVKQDIVDAASQWDDIKGLRVRKFRYKNDPDAPLQIGLVAQEAEVVSPGLVDEAPDYEEVEVTDEDGNVTTERQATGTVTKSVKYSVLYMKSIKALQEAMARIEALEARLEALEA